MSRSFAGFSALAGATALLVLAPAIATAAPSYASAYVTPYQPCCPPGSPIQTTVRVSVEPGRQDETSREISVRYEDEAFVFVDSGGIVPQPLTGQVSEGSTCVSANPYEVRCPVDLSDPTITQTEFSVATGDGDDRIDLRSMPDLPGVRTVASADRGSDGPARPSFSTDGGEDVVLTGAFDAYGSLGEGADRLKGGPGRDGGSGDGPSVDGGPGRDRLIGGPGDDWLVGGDGGDFLKGDAGMDALVGGWGGDRIHARDGEFDRFSCGPGLKRKQPIRRDRVDARIRKDRPEFRGNCLAKN